jgi:hypothetical protein
MKRTSRRTFGKQLTGALAALPLVSLATSTLGQTRRTTAKQREYDRLYHQNTPPPLLIEDGSLTFTFKTTRPTRPLEPTQSGNIYTYSGNVFGAGNNEIHYIRVLHGSGKMLYDDAGKSITLEVQGRGSVNKIGEIVITALPDLLTIKSTPFNTGRADLVHSVTGMIVKRHQYSHQGSGGNDFRISSIMVTNVDDSTQSFSAPPERQGQPFSQEYQIMVWFD